MDYMRDEATGKKRSIGLEEAVMIADRKNSRFVWLGVEPIYKISKILNVERKMIMRLDPEDLLYKEATELADLKDHVLLCYHGRTSHFISDFLQKAHKINTYHLEGGITKLSGKNL